MKKRISRSGLLRLSAACGTGLVSMAASPNPNSVNARIGVPAGVPTMVVWADQRQSGPPDFKYSTFAYFPAYNSKIPYNPNDPSTSPLEAPLHKGGLPYMGNNSYNGSTAAQIFGYADPELTNPKDKVGYGRAFLLPSWLPPDSGNAPPLLMNMATEARPPDLEAVAAAQSGKGSAPTSAQTAATGQLATATLLPANEKNAPVARPTSTAQTRPIAGAKPPVEVVNMKLASAFRSEDALHARSNLPTPLPPR